MQYRRLSSYHVGCTFQAVVQIELSLWLFFYFAAGKLADRTFCGRNTSVDSE
jgi:hypothetical protein